MSKDDLIHSNDRLVAEVSRLKVGLDEVHEMFVNLEKTFVESKASFSLSRYGELKEMIKNVTSEEMMKKVHSLAENQADGKPGVGGLMGNAKSLAAGSTKGEAHPEKSEGRGLSGFFKKIKDVTGFSDSDPLDIRCLDKEDIRRDNERKRREIQRFNTRGLRAYRKLEQLQKKYEASKSHTPPTRYQELKDMIKDAITDHAL
ncbi:hypothetical protein ACOMHN_064696 [Nucella lapillus]